MFHDNSKIVISKNNECHFEVLDVSRHRRSQGRAEGPPIEMLPMIKMSPKRLLFLQFQFILASSRTTVINNNIDPGDLGPVLKL